MDSEVGESMLQQFQEKQPNAILDPFTRSSSHQIQWQGNNDTLVQWSHENTTSSYEDVPYPDFSQIAAVRGVFVCMFLVEFFVGVFGNTMVCLTVYRNKSMHSPVNYYIVNLGICDFLVGAFVLPTKLFELTAEASLNVLNDGWCTAVRYLETIVVFASVFTLMAICIERYYAVVYPVHSRIMTHSRIGRVLFLVWIIPCIVAAPNIYPATATMHYLHSEYGEFTRTTCFDRFSDDFRRGYFIFLFFFMYVLPVIFIGATCMSITRVLMRKIPALPYRDPRAVTLENGRRKVAKMVLVIVFAFVTCWSPYFLVTVITQLQSENFLHQGHFFFTMLCINLLCFTNSCVNPFVYFAMSTRFRKGFKGIIMSMRRCSRRKNNRYLPGDSSSSIRRTSNRGALNCYTSQRNQMGEGGSPPPVTPNNSTGNIKVRPVFHHKGHSKCRRSRTILLNFRTFANPPCEATLVPLQDYDTDNACENLHFQFEDFHRAQESSIV